MYPRDTSCTHAKPLRDIRGGSQARFKVRAPTPGHLHSQSLLGEAIGKVKLRWHGQPPPIDTDGNVATYGKGEVNSAFRSGVDQADKLRAFDDLRPNRVNLRCAVWTPIKLPTWGHIPQMCLQIRTSRRKWASFKDDPEAVYKQLPLGTSHARLAMVSLRIPITAEWVDFRRIPYSPEMRRMFSAITVCPGYFRPSLTSFSVFRLLDTLAIPALLYRTNFQRIPSVRSSNSVRLSVYALKKADRCRAAHRISGITGGISADRETR